MLLFMVEASRREGIRSLVCPSEGGRALRWNPTKDLDWPLHVCALKRIAAPKGVDPYQLYLGFSEVPKLEASMADSKCLDTAVYLSILKMDYVELMCWAIRLR